MASVGSIPCAPIGECVHTQLVVMKRGYTLFVQGKSDRWLASVQGDHQHYYQ